MLEHCLQNLHAAALVKCHCKLGRSRLSKVQSIRCGLTALAFLIGAGTAAQATDVLSGGPLYAGIGQYTAVCYIFNGGPDSITLKGMTLASVSGAPAQLTHNECGAPPATLAPNVACGIAARVSNSIPYTCRYAISPDKVNARGVMEMRDISGVTLRNAELR